MSGGRVIFGAGLGGPIEDEFGSFGDTTDGRVLAAAARRRPGAAVPLLVGRGGQPRWAALSRARRRCCPPRCSGPGRRSGSAASGPAARRCGARRAGTGSRRCSRPPGMDTSRPPRRSASWSAYVDQHRPDTSARFEVVLGGVTPGDPAQAGDVRSDLWPRPAPPGGTSASYRRSDDLHRLQPVLGGCSRVRRGCSSHFSVTSYLDGRRCSTAPSRRAARYATRPAGVEPNRSVRHAS